MKEITPYTSFFINSCFMPIWDFLNYEFVSIQGIGVSFMGLAISILAVLIIIRVLRFVFGV